MTRLFVKNLPLKVTESKIREQFSAHGRVTDVQMKYKDGKFRGICFIGYEVQDQADTAYNQLHNTFFGTNKILVDYAQPIGHKKMEKEEQPEPIAEQKPQHAFRVKIKTTTTLKGGSKDSLKVFNRAAIAKFLSPLECKSIKIPKNTPFVAFVDLNNEADVQKALKQHQSFINGARVQVNRPAGSVPNQSGKANSKWAEQEEKISKAPSVAVSGKLFLRNLAYDITEDELRAILEPYGKIVDINIPVTAMSTNKGIAHVCYMFPENAVRAMNELDETVVKGRVLHILPSTIEEEESIGKTYKEQKVEKAKAQSSSWHNWNMLFLGSNAVVDTVSKKYGISKSSVLDTNGEKSLAARLALEETELVSNTKMFLQENGVSLEAFSKPDIERSKTVFLAKSLSYGTTAAELIEAFQEHGDLGRVVLPEHGLTAIIEFLEPSHAKKAFKAKAYMPFKFLPLFLEWAPAETFTEECKASESAEKIVKPKPNTDRIPDEKTTLYIKNLNFETNEESLKLHFASMGEVSSSLIARRKGLSQGYGFVQYFNATVSRKALVKMQDTVLDGHTLSVKMSDKVINDKVETTRKPHEFGKQTSSVIMVKNIPFQASRKEIYDIFKTFGPLVKVRLPTKTGLNDEHKGFGFVEYRSEDDAKSAFEQVCVSTHLYGRRLVLEWAKGEETIEEIRKRTADKFLDSGRAEKRQKVDENFLFNDHTPKDY